MKTSAVTKGIVVLAHALVGWALCGSIIGIGRSVTTMENTLIVHAIGAPIIFGALAWVYTAKFHYTTPLQTAAIFAGTALLMDGGLIAPFVEKSFAMFADPLGTWIPLGLSFVSAYVVGTLRSRSASGSRLPRQPRALT